MLCLFFFFWTLYKWNQTFLFFCTRFFHPTSLIWNLFLSSIFNTFICIYHVLFLFLSCFPFYCRWLLYLSGFQFLLLQMMLLRIFLCLWIHMCLHFCCMCIWVEFLGHWGSIHSNFVDILTRCFLKWLHKFIFLPAVHEKPSFSTWLSICSSCDFFNFILPGKFVDFQSTLNLYFPEVEHLFICWWPLGYVLL